MTAKYEYKQQLVKQEEVAAFANHQAEDSWRVVAVYPYVRQFLGFVDVLLERPISGVGDA